MTTSRVGPLEGHEIPGTIVVVYAAVRMPLRSSLADHLLSFGRYSGHHVIYVNAAIPGAGLVLRMIDPDLVIYHTLVVDARFDARRMRAVERRLEPLASLEAPKAILPQDEYFDSDRLRRLIAEHRIGHVFSVAPESEWGKIYGDDHGATITRVLTGYLDETTVAHVDRLVERTVRRRDVVYRAWDAEAWLGRHARLKVEVGRRVAERAAEHELRTDITTKGWGDQLRGDAWWSFLIEGRWTVGVEGGASILDHDGTLRARTRAFVAANPTASFEQIEAKCFPGRDGELALRALSPRHLEAALTRTGQVLIDGEYNGILEPGAHYLALRSDFSNLDEVLERMKDEGARIAIVNRAYDDLVSSGRYGYRAFVREVLEHTMPFGPENGAGVSLRARVALGLFGAWSRLWLAGRELMRAIGLPIRRALRKRG